MFRFAPCLDKASTQEVYTHYSRSEIGISASSLGLVPSCLAAATGCHEHAGLCLRWACGGHTQQLRSAQTQPSMQWFLACLTGASRVLKGRQWKAPFSGSLGGHPCSKACEGPQRPKAMWRDQACSDLDPGVAQMLDRSYGDWRDLDWHEKDPGENMDSGEMEGLVKQRDGNHKSQRKHWERKIS